MAAIAAGLLASPAVANEFSLSYSGRLTSADGTPVSGPVDLNFEFFDAATDGIQRGGTKFFADVILTQGLFQVQITLSPAERNAIFPAGASTWIELRDMTNDKTYPRQHYTAVPLALKVPVDGTTIQWNADGELEAVTGGGGTITQVVAGDGLTGGGTTGTVTLDIDYSIIPGLDASGNAVVTSLDGSVITGGTIAAARLPQSSFITDGILSSADWLLFNDKEPAIAAGTALQYWAGNKSWATLNTTAVPEGSRLYFTDARAKSATVADQVADTVVDIAPSQNAVYDQLLLKQNLSAKGQPNGYADLDVSGKLPVARMPFAGLTYKGTWNAGTNVPGLTSSACGSEGDYYIVSVGGATNLDGITTWTLGDWVICGASNSWERVGNSSGGVTTVNSKTGATIVLDTGDIGEGGTNRYFTDTRARAAISASAPLDYDDTTGELSLTAFGSSLDYVRGDLSVGAFQTDVSSNPNVTANTAARHAAVTLGTANGLNLSGQQLSLGTASGGTSGALTSTDWTTFNNKQGAITTGAATQYLKGNLSLGTFQTDVSANADVMANTTARHSAVTIGTANGLSLSGQQVSMGTASATTTGALTSANWNAFNDKVSSQWTTTASDIHYTTGKVGIGTSSPTTPLHVAGSIRIVDGNQAANKVLTSDSNGVATWQSPSAGGSYSIQVFSSNASAVARAACPSGSVPVGGGGRSASGTLLASYPTTETSNSGFTAGTPPLDAATSAASWTCQFSTSGSAHTCYAICM